MERPGGPETVVSPTGRPIIHPAYYLPTYLLTTQPSNHPTVQLINKSINHIITAFWGLKRVMTTGRVIFTRFKPTIFGWF
jgi:hypothetical protein